MFACLVILCLRLCAVSNTSQTIDNNDEQKGFESAFLTVEHMAHSALQQRSDVICCAEQCQLQKGISTVGAQAPSDPVPGPVVLALDMQRH